MTRCREIINEGGCEVKDKNHEGPSLPILEPAASKTQQPKYGITEEFIESMKAWFKDGKMIERRYVWEIVLNCCSILQKEESLVDLVIPEGVTCDIVGDTHGAFYLQCEKFPLTWRFVL